MLLGELTPVYKSYVFISPKLLSAPRTSSVHWTREVIFLVEKWWVFIANGLQWWGSIDIDLQWWVFIVIEIVERTR